MDIYSPPGTKVVFAHPDWGYPYHQEVAAKHLKLGEKYTVDKTDPGDWSTRVYLREVPGVAFNSVLFEPA